MWAWIVIVGGTIGILLYERSKSSSGGTTDPNQVDPATGLTYAQEGAEEQAGIDPLSGQTFASEAAGSSGGSSGSSGDTLSTDPTLADIDAQLVGIGAQLSTLQGGTGLTDGASPGQTFLGEVQDVIAGKSLLDQLFPPAAAPAAPGKSTTDTLTKPPSSTLPGAYVDATKTKPSNGSGNAGKTGQADNKPAAAPAARRTVKYVATPRRPDHKTPPRTVVRGKKGH